MKVIIRKIRHSDYLGIIDLFNEVYDKNIMYHDVDFNENKIIIVAEVANEIVGCAEIDILINEIEDRKYCIVNNICVKKKYERTGIINFLSDTCVNLAKENDCYKVILFSDSNKARQISFSD